MMAKAFKCDRCGELYSDPDASIKIKDGGNFLSCICYGNRTWLSDTKDLCPNCARDFKIWWEHSNLSASAQLKQIEKEMIRKMKENDT